MAFTCPSLFGASPYMPDASVPLKMGDALSTANQRLTTIGSIPHVLHYPGFTLVNCAPAASFPSNGGIGNFSHFFRSRAGYCGGCSIYNHNNAQIAEVCCAPAAA